MEAARAWTREAGSVALMLAAVEAAAVFGALCATLLSAAPPGVSPWPLAGQALAVAACSVLVFYYSGLYDLHALRSFREWAHRLPRGLGLALVPTVAGHLLLPWTSASAGLLLLGLAAASTLLLLARACAHGLLARHPLERVLVVGSSWLAQELVKEIQSRPHLRQRVLGIVDDGTGTLPPGCPRLAGLRELRAVVERVRPHRLIVALAVRRGHMPLKALFDMRLSGIGVEDGVEVYERLTGKIAIEALTPSSLIFCRDYRAFRLDMALARSLSLPVAAVILLLLSPLLALLALAIKVDSRGPVFFVHERVGRRGRPFRLIKFRTMHPASDETSEWARDNRGRLTRVGRWLRRFRLDELPQFINIIRGDMNLVGPRPHPASNLPLFVMVMRNAPECGEQIPYYALRSMVRPGITGWAQVRYRYANDLEEEVEKMRYDLYYIKHMSPWLDLRILFETVKIVVRGRESAHEPPPPRRKLRHSEALRLARATLRVAAGPPLEVGLAPASLVGSPAELVAAPRAEPARVRPDLPKSGPLPVNGESP